MRFKVQIGPEVHEVEVASAGDRLRITIEGESHEARVVRRDGPFFDLEVEAPGPDGAILRRRIPAAGIVQGDRRHLWAAGRLVSYRRLPEGAAVVAEDEAASLSPSIPAVVSEVLVAAGDRVQRGDKLLLLESMKMILPIQAPHAGVVEAVHCAAGDAVQPGVRLVTLSAEEGD
ncbi:MAG: biotin/lipoyl-containing protein [Candidatus Promineifilaceae bacterium]